MRERERAKCGEDPQLLVALAGLASEAGARILEIAGKDLARRDKADRSPVTAADEAAEEVIVEGLRRILPGCPVIAEEAAARGACPDDGNCFVLVDPVDGTKELIAGRGEYTVNIALIEDRRAALGIVYAPGLGSLYAGGCGRAFHDAIAPGAPFDLARASPIRARPRPAAMTALVSRSHPDAATAAFLARHKIGQQIPLGSSLKFARLAEGKADFYPRLGRISQWDVAAGEALLTAAGGSVTAVDGNPIRYGRTESGYELDGFIAWGAPAR